MFPRVTHPSATLCRHSVRLACVKPAASVRSEPGSNSQVVPHSAPPKGNTAGTSRFRCRLVTAQLPPGKLSTSPKHTRPAAFQPPGKDEFENVTARVSHDQTSDPKAQRPTRKDPAVHASSSSHSIVKQRGPTPKGETKTLTTIGNSKPVDLPNPTLDQIQPAEGTKPLNHPAPKDPRSKPET